MKKTVSLWLPLALLASELPAQTNDPWFEIELIAFERQQLATGREQFSDEVKAIPLRGVLDLFKSMYQPNTRTLEQGLPVCGAPQAAPADVVATDWQMQSWDAEPVWLDEVTLAGQSLAQFRGQWPAEPQQFWHSLCKTAALRQSSLQLPVFAEVLPEPAGPLQLPVEPPVSNPVAHRNAPYLTDSSALQLKDLAWQLSHRGGHKLLLHTAWRAALGSKNTSQPLRFYAGQRFSPQFDYSGSPLSAAVTVQSSDSDSLQQAIDLTYRQLQQGRQLQSVTPTTNLATLPQQVWQLDGVIQAYNQRMLFADTRFNFRQTSNNGQQLNTYHSSETVRLLLGELHYLDHPKFGLILQIRRFTPPLLAPTEGT